MLIVKRLLSVPLFLSTAGTKFLWLQPTEIKHLQSAATAVRPSFTFPHAADGVWKNKTGAIWVPDNVADSELFFCVSAHTFFAGHRGQMTTSIALRKHFFLRTLIVNVQSSVSSCVHCLSTTGGSSVRRLFGSAVHGSKPNNSLQFKHLKLGSSSPGQQKNATFRR